MTILTEGNVQHASTLLGLIPSSNNTTSTGLLSRRIRQFSSSLLLPSFPLRWVQRHTLSPNHPLPKHCPSTNDTELQGSHSYLKLRLDTPQHALRHPTLLEGAASLAASVILTLLGAGSTAPCQFFAPLAANAFCNSWSAVFSAFSAIRLMSAISDNTRSIADLDTALSLK